MAEIWDIYNQDRIKTGKLAERGVYKFKTNEYHIVVMAIIINAENKILMSKRSSTKNKYPLMWECCTGSILSGETSLQGMLREIKEELGLFFSPEEAILLKSIKRDKELPDFKDFWLFKKDCQIIPNIQFDIEDYEKALNFSKIHIKEE